MITTANFKDLLLKLGFSQEGNVFSKDFPAVNACLRVDFDREELIYPEDKGLKINERQTCNFKANENVVVFECVCRLFEKGYKPQHIKNDDILKRKAAENPPTYRDADSAKALYEAWKRTYESDYATRGIFEPDVQPYQIGEAKYTVADLQTVAEADIQPKYHEFAAILRQHNVSGRENAFDKLVNLFLCKIVDEKHNPNDLQFYWRGIAFDTYFDLIDRLQRLYRDGMREFLKEDVTYIDNQTIRIL